MSAREAARARRSYSKVGNTAPTDVELAELVIAASRVADHSSLRPWRLITLRGADRERLGDAFAAANGDEKPSTKPLRAPLLIAVVGSYRPSEKVPEWEQEAVASGVAHLLSLLLDEAGWGVIWRTGGLTRHPIVATAHGLGPNEVLLGWLYVGSRPERTSTKPGKTVDVARVISAMPTAAATGSAEDSAPNADTSGKKPAKAKKSAPKSTPTEAELERKRAEKHEKKLKKQLKKQKKKAKRAKKQAKKAKKAKKQAKKQANHVR